ncbi:MAG: hypothetical protein NXI10_03470 [bacterium]|nr:hypothetical protein [bacterium]
MEGIDIKKKLYELALVQDNKVNSIEKEIAIAATETEDPIQYLRDMYRNNGLKYDLQSEFFEMYRGEILSIIEHSSLKVRWLMNSGNYMMELSFLAYQLTLEKLMLHFGLLSTKQTFFAEFKIIDVHTDAHSEQVVRYGISDIELSANVTPAKYVEVRDQQGKILTEAEVYFIEED